MHPKLIQQNVPKKATLTVSRQKAAELIGTADASVQFLLDSGYLPDLDAIRLVTMANYPLLYSDGNYPVLQQALATEIAPEPHLNRTKIGESAEHTDRECVLANQGAWTNFRDSDVLAARFLPVTLRKFTVSVLHVTGILAYNGDRTVYDATLAGRVRELGRPEMNFIDPALSPEDQEIVRTLLTSRSTSNVPGPCGKLKAL
ncbi:transcriptional regulator [Rhodococcus erythropolis]|uniref:Transcriptional regulator n=1 Tax=Rhodococcus erythropolis TaxID=1833 RepID=A0A5N5EDI7_RHOER|nr:transcriptional regulator [Rhodococcus sp. (in: high G+C Gram-positive bacteria)]KAB2585654.1 transcriptional regulator [Rhodococcus erythropolis]RZL24906.1 MAG: transcriptional regulator [Rhodococcus sp. (in: high G+C Gram-positive bacteria)]